MLMDWTPAFTFQNAAAATANGESLAVNNRGAASVVVSGSFVATITFEGSHDNSTFFAIPALNRTTGVSATTASTTGLYYIALNGINFFRTRVTWSSGTSVTIIGRASYTFAPPQEGLGGTTPGPLTNFGAGEYETIAASQTDQMMGPTGAAGDWLEGVLVIPATTSPGGVSIEDGNTNIVVFVGGASSVSNLVPFFIPLGIKSVTGGWEITTGADVSAIGIGNFT